MKILETDRGYKKNIWEYIFEKNGGFPVITAFFAGLICVQAFKVMGAISFDFVFPYLLLIFLMYGFLHKYWIFSIFRKWRETKTLCGKAVAAAVTAAAILGLVTEGALRGNTVLSFIGSFLLAVILYFYIWFVGQIQEENAKGNLYSLKKNYAVYLTAALFAVFCATGKKDIFEVQGWSGWICTFIGEYVLFYLGLKCCLEIFGNIAVRKQKTGNLNAGGRGIQRVVHNRAIMWGIAVFTVTCLVDAVFLLAFFPGVMEYDSFVQMCQVYGAEYSNHHPWLHTMLIKLIYETGYALLGSYNRAFALYCVFQILILAFAFACVLGYLAKKGVRDVYLLLIGAVYILSPINQMYSITMWKDIPFGVTVVLFTVLLCVMRDHLEEGHSNKWCWFAFIPIGFGLCFFRSNGLYVFLGMIPFLIWAFWKQKRAVLSVIAVILALGVVYKGPVFAHFQVKEPDPIESLSIPAQQIAAVISYDGEISEEQKRLLSEVVELEKVPEAYLSSTTCSDAIKNLVRETDNQEYIGEHAGEFVETWVSLFFDNPRIYVEAFIDETRGYWYHNTKFPFIWATYIQENGMGIDRASQLPEKMVQGIRGYLDAYKKHFDEYLSVGLFIYLFFVCLMCAVQKKSNYLIAYLPALGIWGTLLIATPVFADLRYAYAIYLAVPFLTCLTVVDSTSHPIKIPPI